MRNGRALKSIRNHDGRTLWRSIATDTIPPCAGLHMERSLRLSPKHWFATGITSREPRKSSPNRNHRLRFWNTPRSNSWK